MKNKDFDQLSPEMKLLWLVAAIIGFVIFLVAGGKGR
jgi:hypothetical protein